MNDQRLSGWFWRPEYPNDKVSGTAELNNGRISVALLQQFSEGIERKNQSEGIWTSFDVVFGEDHDGEKVVLFTCEYREQRLRSPYSTLQSLKSKLRAERCLWGKRIDFGDYSFREADVEIDWLEQWSRCEGLIDYSYEGDKEIYAVTTISKDLTKSIEIEGMMVQLICEIERGYNGISLVAEPRTYFRITGVESLSLDRVVFVAKRLCELVSFGLRAICSVKTITAKKAPSSTADPEVINPQFSLIDRTLGTIADETLRRPPYIPLFDYGHIEGEVELRISEWVSSYETFKPLYDAYSYLHERTNISFETKIIYYVRMIESYWGRAKPEENYVGHEDYQDWLENRLPLTFPESFSENLQGYIVNVLKRLNNRLNLGDVIRVLLEEHSDELVIGFFPGQGGALNQRSRNRFLNKLRDLRNKLSHGARMEEAIDRSEIPLALHMTKILAQICLMRAAGFAFEMIDDRLLDAYRNLKIPLPSKR